MVSLDGLLKNSNLGVGNSLVAKGLSTSIDDCCKSPWLYSSLSKQFELGRKNLYH